MAEQIRPRGLPEHRDDEHPGRPGDRKPKKLQRRTYAKRSQPRKRRLQTGTLVRATAFEVMREMCFIRDSWRCVRFGCPGPLQAHHRKLLSQGGPDALSNLATLCAECHEWCHKHPAKAQLGGWIVPSWADPARRAMFLHDGRLVLLDDAGGYAWEGVPA